MTTVLPPVAALEFVGTDPVKGLKNKGFLGSVPNESDITIWAELKSVESVCNILV